MDDDVACSSGYVELHHWLLDDCQLKYIYLNYIKIFIKIENDKSAILHTKKFRIP